MSGPEGGPPPPHIQPGVSMTIASGPVDLVKTGTVPQIRIPSVSVTSIQRIVSTPATQRPTLIAPQVSVVPAPGRPLIGSVTVSKPSLSVSNITMLPNTGRIGSLSQVRPGTRPVLAAPQPSRVTTPQPRSAVATPIIRGGQIQSLVGGIVTHRPTLQASQGTVGRLQSTPVTVQWTTLPTTTVAGARSVPRAPTVVPVGTRTVAMTPLAFRPSLTVSRPSAGETRVSLAQPGVQSKALVSPSAGIKPIGVQTHIGVGISTQVGVASQVALKPAVPSPRSTSMGAAPRATGRMVSPTPLVSLTPATHIQVPLVPTGPKPRVQRMVTPTTLAQGSATVQITTPRTITLPYSGQQAKAGVPPAAAIPIARVPPQPSQAREGTAATPGFVYHLPVTRADPQQPAQSAPVNLTITDRTVRPPAMTMPSFTPTILYESPRSENSVTITTLPPPQQQDQQSIPPPPGPATVTPARITPILPTQEQEKPVPGSPRPSILRKREGEGTPVKIQVPHPPSSPPTRPDSSSGSSTVSAPSSAALSGDEQTTVQTSQATTAAHLEPSPRKKPRKQQLPPSSAVNVSPEWVAVKRELGARDRLEWEGGRVLNSGEPGWEGRVSNWNSGTGRGWTQGGGEGRGWGGEGRGWSGEGEGRSWGAKWTDSKEVDQADDEEEVTTDEEKMEGSTVLKGKPMMTLKDNKPWKSRHNHFLRYSDVKPKDERRPTVNELANQKYVYQKINGWKIYHLSAGMEDIIDMESELSKKLQGISKRLEETANDDVTLTKIQELLKANIQRSKVIQEQLREAKQHSQSVFVHKSKMQNIISKYHNKRASRRSEKC